MPTASVGMAPDLPQPSPSSEPWLGGTDDATYCEIRSTYGHDAFLLEVEEETHLIKHFLKKVYKEGT